MASEMVGRNSMLFMNYTHTLHRCRKLVATLVKARGEAKYLAVREAVALKFVLSLRRSSGTDLLEICRWCVLAPRHRLIGARDNG